MGVTSCRSLTSSTIKVQDEVTRAHQDLEKGSDIIVSAPGTFFWAGEKAILHGAPATCMKVPRRVYVGLKGFAARRNPVIQLGSSQILVKKPEEEGFSLKEYGGAHEDLQRALAGAASAYRALTGSNLRSSYQLEILSEWEGDYGLGWSGAFASALSTALLVGEERLDDPRKQSSYNPKALIKDRDFDNTMRLGWCIESVMHDGRASGSAVCGSMICTGLPFSYRAACMPQLWTVDSDTQKKDDLCKRPSTFVPIVEKGKYSFRYLPSNLAPRDRPDAELRIVQRLFTTRDVLVLHSGVRKSTPEAARYELTQGSWLNANLIRAAHYRALVNTCKCVSKVAAELVERAQRDLDSTTIDERWDDLSSLATRTHGHLTSLGFSFPAGDEILGTVLNRFSRAPGSQSIGGKLTGAGRGGDLVLFARAGTAEELATIEDVIADIRVRNSCSNPRSCPPLSRVHTLYSARRDGVEQGGLVLHKPSGREQGGYEVD